MRHGSWIFLALLAALLCSSATGASRVFQSPHALNHVVGAAVSAVDAVSPVSVATALGYDVNATDQTLNQATRWGNQALGTAATYAGGDPSSQAAKFGDFAVMFIPFDRIAALGARTAEAIGEGISVESKADEIVTGASRAVEEANVGTELDKAVKNYASAEDVERIQAKNGCPDGSRSCFVAGTLVATADGLQPIETIQPSELVWSCDPQTGETNLNRVERTYVRTAPATITLEIGGAAITCTPDHPYWVVNHGWTVAGQLHPGDLVRTLAGTNAPVASINEQPGSVTVYNFEVARSHSYFVGTAAVLVHNGPCPQLEFDFAKGDLSGRLTASEGAGIAEGGAAETTAAAEGVGSSAQLDFDFAAEGAEVAGSVKSGSVVPYRPINPGFENHHGVLDVWASKNIPGYVSRASSNPTIALTAGEHTATKVVYRDWLEEMTGKRVGGVVDWTKVGPREAQSLSERMFDAANVSPEARQNYYNSFYQYIYSLP